MTGSFVTKNTCFESSGTSDGIRRKRDYRKSGGCGGSTRIGNEQDGDFETTNSRTMALRGRRGRVGRSKRRTRRAIVLGNERCGCHIVERDYYTPPGFGGVPCVCMRIPTGGGKTLLAAHAVGTIGDKLLGTDRPVCLWITPSTTIRDQTLRGLQKPPHYAASGNI